MIRATKVFAAEDWSHVATDRVVLDYEGRHRRRLAMTGERGTEFLLDLPETAALRDGDGLLLEDGRIVEVKAAPETLTEVRGRDGDHLLRLAWHLGNRHLPTQILGDRLLIRHDHQGLDLKADYARECMKSLVRVWKRPVNLLTIVEGKQVMIRFDGREHSTRHMRP